MVNHLDSSSEIDVRQTRVLLVDDDEVNLLLTSSALRERGFLIFESSNARDALKHLDDIRPDVLVLDAVMPDMDGFEMCQQLRESHA